MMKQGQTNDRMRKQALCLTALLLCGCSAGMAELKTRPTIAEEPMQAAAPAPGTIWAGENTHNLLYGDRKARYVNDIVTIIISEQASGGNKATTNTSRDTTTGAEITALLGIDKSITNSNANMGGKIELGGSSTNALKGTGDTTRGGNLVARLTARITRVMTNGNLVIEGRRQVTVNSEDQFIFMSGIIRPEDITADNYVYSQYIADARIIYTGDGVINDKMRPGWLTRVVDWVWPF
ncbi:MAG: flagellar basal body L-ring protein FlgH [Syntrophales bacterium]